jgi:hypothetical protein
MDFSGINWLAVAASIVASFVIGFIYYLPKVFFNTWWVALGKSLKEQPKPDPMIWVFTFLASAVEAVFLALLINTMGSSGLVAGLTAGFMIWLGFVAPTNLVNNLFAGRKWVVFFIEAGNHLLYLLAAGAILASWPK